MTVLWPPFQGVNMTDLHMCPDCGAAVEYDEETFWTECPDCGRRLQPRAGAC